ncbi:MAG TPA: bacteriohopanetetrol glucosamine biosynthesis glycosyltransferase HpnI [Hyphomicrobiaceae bacterium]|nr:bacteriohopanetetrol glucosamine biosynthesis glycosyltransferase HpnI [Hyphomicrobiaceae bacterium]
MPTSGPELTPSLWLICTALAMVGSAYLVFAASLMRKLKDGASPHLRSDHAVTILKPLCGTEPGLEANLASFCAQVYPGPVQIVFGVSEATDPATAVVHRLITQFPHADIALVVGTDVHGANRKISNLINMAAHARHGLIVLSDSDIRVDQHYLRQVVAALDQPGVGAVTCLYRGTADERLCSRLAAMAINHHFLPNVLVGLALGLARPCFGSTIALTAATLNRIGGLEPFANQLADDYAIGKAVRDLGLRVAVPPLVVDHTCFGTTWSELVRREARWARTIRLIDPAGHAGSIITHPLPFALAAAGLDGWSATGLGIIALALVCRVLAPVQIGGMGDSVGASLWLTPLRDLLSFVILLASFLPGPIAWRDRRYRVGSNGTLTPT